MPEQSDTPSAPRETQPLHAPPNAELERGDDVVYDAVRVEYRDMASWYDCFWRSYTAACSSERPPGPAAVGSAAIVRAIARLVL